MRTYVRWMPDQVGHDSVGGYSTFLFFVIFVRSFRIVIFVCFFSVIFVLDTKIYAPSLSSSCLTRRSINNIIPIMKQMYVYIMASGFNGTLYVGVTSDLIKRVWQHKNHVVPGFTDKYNIDKLVYYELWQDELGAIQREKQIKHWHRQWKKDLIEKENPEWLDLYNTLLG